MQLGVDVSPPLINLKTIDTVTGASQCINDKLCEATNSPYSMEERQALTHVVLDLNPCDL